MLPIRTAGIVGAAGTTGGGSLVLPTTNLVAAWDARTGISESGGLVSAWNDISGNGYHLTEASPASQPSLITVDGFPAVEFQNLRRLRNTSYITATPVAKTFYLVAKFDSNASQYRTVMGSSSHWFGLVRASSTTRYGLYDGGVNNMTTTIPTTLHRTTYAMDYALTWNAYGTGGYSEADNKSSINFAMQNSIAVGATTNNFYALGGSISALFVYHGPRDTEVEDYITQEWGV